jgi:hypothetical protein
VGRLDKYRRNIQTKIREVSALFMHQFRHTVIPVFSYGLALKGAVVRCPCEGGGCLSHTIVDRVDVAIISVLFTAGSTRVDRQSHFIHMKHIWDKITKIV